VLGGKCKAASFTLFYPQRSRDRGGIAAFFCGAADRILSVVCNVYAAEIEFQSAGE